MQRPGTRQRSKCLFPSIPLAFWPFSVGCGFPFYPRKVKLLVGDLRRFGLPQVSLPQVFNFRRYYDVPHGTRIYVLQTVKGAQRWPFTEVRFQGRGRGGVEGGHSPKAVPWSFGVGKFRFSSNWAKKKRALSLVVSCMESTGARSGFFCGCSLLRYVWCVRWGLFKGQRKGYWVGSTADTLSCFRRFAYFVANPRTWISAFQAIDEA